MARHTKVTLKKRQKYGLAPESDSIRRKNIRKPKQSAYAERLEQKQKLKLIYGIMEKQMTRYVREAFNSQRDVQVELMQKLENRLDNIVYRLGLGKTREQSRQLVNHGHVLVNDKKVDIASYNVKQGEIITLRKKTIGKRFFLELVENNRKAIAQVSYLGYEANGGRVLGLPAQTDVEQNVDISKVLEFYRQKI
ncbi:MAG: 30S ribosomal protein S4 [Patescibacteria group bacterium]